MSQSSALHSEVDGLLPKKLLFVSLHNRKQNAETLPTSLVRRGAIFLAISSCLL